MKFENLYILLRYPRLKLYEADYKWILPAFCNNIPEEWEVVAEERTDDGGLLIGLYRVEKVETIKKYY